MIARKHILLISVALFFSLPATVSAATISLLATPARVGVGDVVRVSVLLDSAISTNVFSGAVAYPGALLVPIAVSDGSSLVNFWVTHPEVPAKDAPIQFAGMTPGGFSGNNGILFSILFRTKVAGTANVSLGTVEILRNDGEGGREPTTIHPLALIIGPKSSGGYTEPVDVTPPESFTAYLGTDPQLFGGRLYTAFTAVDKGSGVDRYMVAESRVPSFLFPLLPLSWNETTSPYVLADQNQTSTVYIKAIDRAGNERLSIFPPRRLFTAYEMAVLLGILVVGVAIIRNL